MQFAFAIHKVPTVADLEDEKFEVDLSHKIYLQPDKIVATEAACHTLRLLKIIKGLSASDQTLFREVVIMCKAYMSANGLLGNVYGHMTSAAISVLVAYALLTRQVPTAGGLGACFPALLRWLPDAMEAPLRDGWGAVLSLPGRDVTSELDAYKGNALRGTYGKAEPVIVAAMVRPLRNLTRNVHLYHLQHLAEVLRGHGVQLQEGRKVEEVMRGFTAPYLESFNAMPGYTHRFLTVVGSELEGIGDEELETVYELAALKMLPMAQILAACADIMGYYLFPKPVLITHGPGGQYDLREALDHHPRAYRGFLHAVRLRDLDINGKHGMNSVPKTIEEAFTAVGGAVFGTLRGGGPGGKSFPKHEAKHVYVQTYLLGTGDDGGHVFSKETRLNKVYPDAAGKRKRDESVVGRDQATEGGAKEAAADEREERKKARNKRKNEKRKEKRQQGGGGGGGGGLTEAKEQEGQEEEEEIIEEEEGEDKGEGAMKGADLPEGTEGK